MQNTTPDKVPVKRSPMLDEAPHGITEEHAREMLKNLTPEEKVRLLHFLRALQKNTE